MHVIRGGGYMHVDTSIARESVFVCTRVSHRLSPSLPPSLSVCMSVNPKP